MWTDNIKVRMILMYRAWWCVYYHKRRRFTLIFCSADYFFCKVFLICKKVYILLYIGDDKIDLWKWNNEIFWTLYTLLPLRPRPSYTINNLNKARLPPLVGWNWSTAQSDDFWRSLFLLFFPSWRAGERTPPLERG